MTRYLVEIQVVEKQELPPGAQEIELLPFLNDHLHDLTKNNDVTRFIIFATRLYSDLDA